MGQCKTTYYKRDPLTGKNQAFPCGKCPVCYKRRVSQWSFRLQQEAKHAYHLQFLTLTYADKNLPFTTTGQPTLDKRDLQLFFKRLRKHDLNRDLAIKYYAVGEYGGKTYRPHYHIILFNAEIESLAPAWNLGKIYVGQINGASIGYTLKYLCKHSSIGLSQKDKRVSEFGLMSKGLGSNYLTIAMKKWHKANKNERMYCNLPDGKKVAMPRYYKDKLYTKQEREIIGYHMRQKALEEQFKNEENEAFQWEQLQSDLHEFRKLKLNQISKLKI